MSAEAIIEAVLQECLGWQNKLSEYAPEAVLMCADSMIRRTRPARKVLAEPNIAASLDTQEMKFYEI